MSTKGLKRYTDGTSNKMFLPGQQPDGWYLGVSESYRKANSVAHIGQHSLYDGKTDEEKQEIKNKISQARTKFFSDDENRKRQSEKIKEKYCDDNFRTLHLQAVRSCETRNKISEKSKRQWENMTDEQKKDRLQSIRDGYNRNGSAKKVSEKFKIYWQNEDYRNKRLDTMRKNNSFNRSLEEDAFYNYLKSVYGEEDVIRQYSDSRYPFNCDFYIKSLDLFIECNFHWTHGGRPYDSTDQSCMEQLRLWESKESDFYNNAIHTWTVRDVEKYNTLKNGNLNYIIIYDKDIVYSHWKQ